jgi:restriction endonuclease Mrr
MPPSLREVNNSLLDPAIFEEEIAWLITATTGHDAKVVGGSGDKGVDVEVFNESGKRIGIVQCKRYDPSRPLPPNHIRELYAVKHRFRVRTAYLATTAYFSDSSRKEARELGIRLMDGKTIRQMQKKAHSGLFQ